MERAPKSMARKRQRYYNETKTVLSVAIIITGVCFLVCLQVIYPQIYSSAIFDSRLAYHLTLDIDDYYTCDKDYEAFVYSEPDPVDAMYQLYIFNVTNAMDILQRGSKPGLVETGPYGFKKNVYKYDIEFPDTVLSPEVSFKEYNTLEELDDPKRCENMYYALEKDYSQATPCVGDECYCKDLDAPVTVVNPLFLKVINEDRANELLAYYSVDVFTEVKRVLEGPFVEAVRSTLVYRALKEVYLFRMQMKHGDLTKVAYTNLLSQGYTEAQLAGTRDYENVTDCGLGAYGITACPFKPYRITQEVFNAFSDIDDSNYPSIAYVLDEVNSFSFLNHDYGLSRWVALCWYYGYIEFQPPIGYTMVNKEDDISAVAAEFTALLAELAFGASPSADQILGASRVIEYTAKYIGEDWIVTYELSGLLKKMAYDEFNSTHAPVICAPLGQKCVWQWGFMRQFNSADFEISTSMLTSMIDLDTQVSTNFNNFYEDTNGAPWYNSYTYCTKVYRPEPDLILSCTNYEYTLNDAILTRPAGIWGKDSDVKTTNANELIDLFKSEPEDVQGQYFQFACNVSMLMHHTYRTETTFHDDFTVRYLNKNKDPLLNHTFTVGNWKELGMAQWGGGFVTHALNKIRTVNQFKRDGMWRIGREDYINRLIEFSSWSNTQGFPQAWIYSVEDSTKLLNGLIRRDQVGVDFRKHVTYAGTTFFGTGEKFINGVGEEGDVAFVFEVPDGNFSCPEQPEVAELCEILNTKLVSSADGCIQVQNLYETCSERYLYDGDDWIDDKQCSNFETSETSSSGGIKCSEKQVYGNAHPFTKSRGNVLFQMMYGLTQRLMLLDGLWCPQADGCAFNRGGLFTTTTARKLLFNGYTEASLLKYFNLKYESKDVSFECVSDAFDQCGIQNFHCDYNGIKMNLPNGRSKVLKYGALEHEEFFAPHFEVTASGVLIWPFSMKASNRENAIAVRNWEESKGREVTQIRNPHWAAYPAWNTNDTEFNKYYQCQRRLYGGIPDQFSSCVDTLYTGTADVRQALKNKEYHGNSTIRTLNYSYSLNGTSDESRQYPSSLWSGFKTYPYSYRGLSTGKNYSEMESPVIFNKQHSIFLELSQSDLFFDFQKEIAMSVPFNAGPKGLPDTGTAGSTTSSPILPTRRFSEDGLTWDKIRWTSKPTDSNGMPYQVPVGMASLEKYTGFPLFADTPHFYGNEEWGGLEYSLVSGTIPEKNLHRTFLDYDPVTGYSHRQAMRQQVTLRHAADPLFPLIFSSQSRCQLPTKAFAAGTGYGCFTYIPLLWYEDASNVKPERFNRLYDHFYLRPERASVIGILGIAAGVVLLLVGMMLFISELYHRQKFLSRVYVDP